MPILLLLLLTALRDRSVLKYLDLIQVLPPASLYTTAVAAPDNKPVLYCFVWDLCEQRFMAFVLFANASHIIFSNETVTKTIHCFCLQTPALHFAWFVVGKARLIVHFMPQANSRLSHRPQFKGVNIRLKICCVSNVSSNVLRLHRFPPYRASNISLFDSRCWVVDSCVSCEISSAQFSLICSTRLV